MGVSVLLNIDNFLSCLPCFVVNSFAVSSFNECEVNRGHLNLVAPV